MNLNEVTFSFIDTETTGNVPDFDQPIEIAASNWNPEKGFVGDMGVWLAKPTVRIHPSAQAVHHISLNDLKEQPTLESIKPDIIKYTENTILVAHNAPYDQGMLPFLPNQWIDMLRFAKQIWKKGDLNEDGVDLSSHKSQELRYWLKLDVDTKDMPAHRAPADILVTTAVFNCALTKYKQLTNNQANTLEELVKFIEAPIMVEKMTFGKHKDALLTDVDDGYYGWLLERIDAGQMSIDVDLQHSIINVLKSRSIDPEQLIATQKQKSKQTFRK